MSVGGPPVGIAPERVFRSLLAPRPSRLLTYRLSCVPTLPLHVVALHSVAENEAVEMARSGPVEVRPSRIASEVMARCLWAGEGPAFSNASEVGLLDEGQFSALWAEASTALAHISPTYARSDADEWARVLERGARHPTNMHDAMVLAACIDSGFHHTVYRPDRYWGVATRDLLDGHWMAFRAARHVWEEMAKRNRT